jgi:carboxypeptidase C (cathepsin A)
LWLTGGPGCSSELAVLFENGPWNVNADMSLSLNNYSWNKQANVLYVDSPVGTGFSYTSQGGYATNEFQVADQLYTLIQVTMMDGFRFYSFYILFTSLYSYTFLLFLTLLNSFTFFTLLNSS